MPARTVRTRPAPIRGDGPLAWLRRQQDRLRPFYAQIRRTLWLRPVVYGALAVLGVGLGLLADHLGLELGALVDEELASLVLSVLTASMLGVATFAVASMVSAYASVAQLATPRAFDLIVGDDGSKTALSSFVASFVFATVGNIAVTSHALGDSGRLVLFVLTLLVYFGVIVVFLRWVDAIARLGRVGTAIARVEHATAAALARYAAAPHLGAAPLPLHGRRDHPLSLEQIGYVVDIDLPGLQRLAERHAVELEVCVVVGAFVGPSVTAVWASEALDEEVASAVRRAFVVRSRRGFVVDPANGFIVLAEIGCRALSPAVNDSGTAIEVLRSAARLLLEHVPARADEPLYPAIGLADLDVEALFESFFPRIARDGAGRDEVVDALRESLQLVGATPAMAELAGRFEEVVEGRTRSSNVRTPRDRHGGGG